MTLIFPISLILLSGLVSASLYPTCPIAKTVYRGGTWNNITWIDSAESPPLDQLGNMSIHLWVDDTMELETLATEVDPRLMFQNIFIPENLWTDSSNYDIRFKSTDPPVIIYTAYFTITGMKGNGSSDSGDELGSSTPSSDVDAPASSTLPSIPDGGNNDMVTVTMERLDSNTVPFPSSTTTASGTTGSTTTTTGAGAVGAMANDASSGGRHVRKSSMKFNVVFVIFPALFGVALAL